MGVTFLTGSFFVTDVFFCTPVIIYEIYIDRHFFTKNYLKLALKQ